MLCAQSLSRVQLFCDTMDCSPPGTSVHGDSPDKNTGVGCHAILLQGTFPTQGSNQGLQHCRWTLLSEPPRRVLETIKSIQGQGGPWEGVSLMSCPSLDLPNYPTPHLVRCVIQPQGPLKALSLYLPFLNQDKPLLPSLSATPPMKPAPPVEK